VNELATEIQRQQQPPPTYTQQRILSKFKMADTIRHSALTP